MKLIKGDITKAKLHNVVIVQQVNCRNEMDAGIAKALYTRFPKIKTEYHKFCEANQGNLFIQSKPDVMVQAVPVEDENAKNVIVLNLFSQNDCGHDPYVKYTDEAKLINGLHYAQEVAAPTHMLLVPYDIGCGLGNGNADVIHDTIKQLDNVVAVEFEQGKSFTIK